MRFTLKSSLAALCLLSQPAFGADVSSNLTILVDGSLSLPLSQIARDYTKTSHQAVTVVVIDGRDPTQQIAQGLDANVLITANPLLINSLNASGLIDVFSRREVAHTQLALVAPLDVALSSNVAKHISFAAILYAQPNIPLYVSDPATVDGARAQQFLTSKTDLPSQMGRTVTVGNRAELLEAMAKKPGFALMLATDALQEPSLKILTILPNELASPIDYEAVLVAGMQMDASRDFITYMTNDAGQSVFRHDGFAPAQSK